MSKNNRLAFTILLILLLVVVPIGIMAIMGIDHWDANEGLIFIAAIAADIAIYLAYRLFMRRFSF